MMVMNDHELCFFSGFFLHCTTGFGIWYLVSGYRVDGLLFNFIAIYNFVLMPILLFLW